MNSNRLLNYCLITTIAYIVIGLWSWISANYSDHRLSIVYMGAGLLILCPFLWRQSVVAGRIFAIAMVAYFILLMMPIRMSYITNNYMGVARMLFLDLFTLFVLIRIRKII